MEILKQKYPLEYSRLYPEFKKFWDSKNFYNGKKIGILSFKDGIIEYYHTDYMTMRFIYNYLRYEAKLESYELNSSLGFHTIIRDKNKYIVTQRKYNLKGEKEKVYQLSTSEGVECKDLLKGDIISKLIERSLIEELGVKLENPSYKFVCYSDSDNRPYILYEIVINNVKELLENKQQSLDSQTKTEDIHKIEVVNTEQLKEIGNKEKLDVVQKYLRYLKEH